ncbi:MAG: hypothetical protein OXI63_16040 [Candidatus Poribacteria bacterium]|nr:hypothetical protein [Candidatus Poribacteria bacterium]
MHKILDFEMSDRLNLNTDWSIGETAFERIATLLLRVPTIERILEFGSGPSSIRLAMAFPEAEVLSIEGDWQNFRENTDLMRTFWDKRNLLIKYRPVTLESYGDAEFLTYEGRTFWNDQKEMDCVIIDGPPFYTLRGREACLYQVYDQIKIGGLVILDDFRRSYEKQIVENWLSVYPSSFTVEIFQEDHHLAVLRKIKSVTPCWDAPYRLSDVQTVSATRSRIAKALSHIDDVYLSDLTKGTNWETDMIGLFNTLRNIYGVTPERIQEFADRTIRPTEALKKKQNACYITIADTFCLNKMGIKQHPLL